MTQILSSETCLSFGCLSAAFLQLTITVVGVLGMRVSSLGVAGKVLKMQMPVCQSVFSDL